MQVIVQNRYVSPLAPNQTFDLLEEAFSRVPELKRVDAKKAAGTISLVWKSKGLMSQPVAVVMSFSPRETSTEITLKTVFMLALEVDRFRGESVHTSLLEIIQVTLGAASPNLSDLKVCAYCAETIKSAALVCRFCGRDQ